ncbi:exonuclease 1 [Galdieria sulphuraria]|uniref:Exonuclease 1 n=1 Tax=Galdieria sulphuraria TaxID=130081 RepID=M2XTI4_GALSU|nr:exonuclease 1 [Galdieria sulphuraria]EME26963.1 exonuclease 1 [Galdieria sulphuraria]|eukprot:XP_005703483.1 exonuclease 1 [Galdieria sulphuraria]
MGIQGLLPVLRPISEAIHIQKFANKRVGIDGYSWLHKGAFGCALELCTGVSTSRYLDYFIERIKMLLYYNVVPVVVFDGARLPVKSETEAIRRESREMYLEKGKKLMKEKKWTHAVECFQRAVNITPIMAHQVSQVLIEMGIAVTVAPYEADAQLAWLCFQNEVDAVITEDSDLIAYGVNRIIYKMGRSGDGFLISRKNLGALEGLALSYFTQDMLQLMSIIAGCDFFPGIRGLGIKKAHEIVKRYHTLDRVFWFLKNNPKFQVEQDDRERMAKALMTFKYQRVYDHRHQKLVFLTQLRENDPLVHSMMKVDANLEFLGPLIPDDIVQGIAQGRLHPCTWECIIDHSQSNKSACLDEQTTVKSPTKQRGIVVRKDKSPSVTSQPTSKTNCCPRIRILDFFQKPKTSRNLTSIVSSPWLNVIRGKRKEVKESMIDSDCNSSLKKCKRESLEKGILQPNQNIINRLSEKDNGNLDHFRYQPSQDGTSIPCSRK